MKYIRAIPSRVVEMPGTQEPARPLLRRDGRRAAAGIRPGGAQRGPAGPGRASRRWPGGWGWTSTSSASPRPTGWRPLATSQARPLRGRRVPGAQGHPRVGGPGLGGRRLRHGAAGPARGTMIQRHEYPWERDVTDEAPRVGVFICHCGHNIASVIDVEQVAESAAGMPNVVPRRGQPLHLLGHQPAAHQGHDPGAPAQPAGGGLLLAADARDPLPGDAARERAEPVPVRHDQHPRPVLLGAQGRPGRGHREGRST